MGVEQSRDHHAGTVDDDLDREEPEEELGGLAHDSTASALESERLRPDERLGKTVPMSARVPIAMTARLKTWLAKRQAASSPVSDLSSRKVGMNSDERMPPATSSKIMFGMLFAA